MFIDFFYLLRERKVPVSIKEFMNLMEALDKGLINSPTEFYYVARSLLVKDEKYFDEYDKVFLHYFKDAELPPQISDMIKQWLESPIEAIREKIPPELRKYFDNVADLEELRERLREMLRIQKERHDLGNRYIGTGGTSPFGWGGHHPGGIRIQGWGGMGMASKIAERRRFRNYRSDQIIDTRQFKVALKKLRKLNRIGAPDELDLDKTIDKTVKNFGDIELVFTKRKKNNIKLLLLMDVGGSMDPFASLVSKLFSAAHSSTHFRKFKYFYFHNCIYTKLYEDIELEKYVPTADILRKYDSDYRVIIIGDAAMAPSELVSTYGSIHIWDETYTPGIVWLNRIKEKFPKSVWLNPEVIGAWKPYTREVIEQIFPMFDLTIDGLDEAIKVLK
ncbi:MAG: vWA domain-containing protein [Promethearchaeota archaeon]